ncbi:hypothetical protein EXIGLDRAFT_779781 [Exidia glandulosa HHB12029]|uniref:Uncharacterized protein n=1 Tax=Exidia glandulosa HHB12029 TaxID=1314781 RepID=A0A165BWM9_EXIGL|nr:hypothetical protein EXIGLDRAFT_779781 [Exidia glandulosa HHB12029]
MRPRPTSDEHAHRSSANLGQQHRHTITVLGAGHCKAPLRLLRDQVDECVFLACSIHFFFVIGPILFRRTRPSRLRASPALPDVRSGTTHTVAYTHSTASSAIWTSRTDSHCCMSNMSYARVSSARTNTHPSRALIHGHGSEGNFWPFMAKCDEVRRCAEQKTVVFTRARAAGPRLACSMYLDALRLRNRQSVLDAATDAVAGNVAQPGMPRRTPICMP